ncbi:hypothetical protein TI39_contig684g00003 [Zymoseptoria brevis]|uniref:SMODS and SLOG-associating 2TM effector domain-containing protein n=1 Tax=Zymoseptoria brevis TaxID=1047168 RepID=A0A0F4GG77_9PEZI|nr:hypothetical protein TI39_contig684g00003 [Zymoseptoria brevis]
MDATLDFVGRARHAFAEFRHPSQMGFDTEQQQPEAVHKPSIAPLIEPNSQLHDFRLLVGIWQDKSYTSKHGFKANRLPEASTLERPAPNIGIYSTVCECEIKAKRNYKSSARLINFCYGLQIIVAAALTALGAASASNKAVTAFGAVNTCIAGFLTYIKGSGLPFRVKYYQHEWAKIREYIEQRERDFSYTSHGLNVLEEVEKIRTMYDTLRADIEANRPDRFVSVTQLGRPVAVQPHPTLSADMMSKRWNEKEAEAEETIHKVQGTVSNLMADARGLKSIVEEKLKDISHMEKDMETTGRRMVNDKKQELNKQLNATVRDVEALGQDLQHTARAAISEQVTAGQGPARNMITRAQSGVNNAVSHHADVARTAVGHAGEESVPPK